MTFFSSHEFWWKADISFTCFARTTCKAYQSLPPLILKSEGLISVCFLIGLSSCIWRACLEHFLILKMTCLSGWLAGLRPCVQTQWFPAALSATVLWKSVNQTRVFANDAVHFQKAVGDLYKCFTWKLCLSFHKLKYNLIFNVILKITMWHNMNHIVPQTLTE